MVGLKRPSPNSASLHAGRFAKISRSSSSTTTSQSRSSLLVSSSQTREASSTASATSGAMSQPRGTTSVSSSQQRGSFVITKPQSRPINPSQTRESSTAASVSQIRGMSSAVVSQMCATSSGAMSQSRGTTSTSASQQRGSFVITKSQSRPINPSQSSTRFDNDRCSQWYNDSTRFANAMAECGVKLSCSPHHPSVLSHEPVEIVQTLTKMCDDAVPKDTFLTLLTDGFVKYIRLPMRFLAAVMPTTMASETNDADETLPSMATCESVARLMLNVDALQWRVAEAVLERFAEFLQTETSIDKGVLKNVDIASLVVDQFRYLDTIKQGEKICNYLLDSVVPICDKGLVAHIFTCLPQLIDGSQRAENVASKIRAMMETDKEILCPALEAIGNLPLTDETLKILRDNILHSLAEYSSDGKIAAFKFLLETAEAAGNVFELFCELREVGVCVCFENSVEQPGSETENTQREATTGKLNRRMASDVAKLLESAFKRSKVLSDAAVRVETAASVRGHKDNLFDMVMTLVLFSPRRHRQGCGLIRQKVVNGCWTEDILDECFNYHEVTSLYRRSILNIADFLIRAPERKLTALGADLYRRLFFAVVDREKHEIVSSLVMHVSNGNEQQANVALGALDGLASSKQLNEYGMPLQGLLDSVERMKFYQIRKMIALFGEMSVNGEEAPLPLEDLLAFVKKYVNENSVRHKAIGIVAGLTLCRYLIDNDTLRDQAMTLFQLAESGSLGRAALRSLFYDELSSLINGGGMKNTRLLGEMKEKMVNILEQYLIMDVGRLSSQTDLLGVHGNAQPTLALKILPDDSNYAAMSSSESSALLLPSILRLYLACEWELSGNFSEVDLLLNAPFVLRKRENWVRMDDVRAAEQELTCLELLQCGNGLIELINASARQNWSNETGGIIMNRLNDLVMLESEFASCAQMTPTFSIPNEFDPSPKKHNASKPVSKSKASKCGKGSRRNKNTSGKLTQQTLCTDLISQAISMDGRQTQANSGARTDDAGASRKADASPGPVGHFFRGFDFHSFGAFRWPLVCSNIQSQSNEPELTPSTLVYLLGKLSEKMVHLRMASANKRGFSAAARTSGMSVDRLDPAPLALLQEHLQTIVPNVWKHLLTSLAYFEGIAARNDGIVDYVPREAATIAKGIELCVECLSKYLAWLDENETRTALVSVLKSFSSESVEEEETDVAKLVGFAVNSLIQYAPFMPTLNVAVNLLQGINAFVKLNVSDEKPSRVAELADQYLRREWELEDSGERSSGTNKTLAIVIELAFTTSTMTKRLEKLEVGIVALSKFSEADSSASNVYKSISKSTVSTWYRTLFISLVAAAKRCPRLRGNANSKETEEWLTQWVKVAVCFRLIIRTVKASSPKQVFAAALYHSSGLVQLFSNEVVSTLESKFFQIDPKAIKQLLSVVQCATRLLHDICLEAKMAKDRFLMKFVPQVKRALEALVFRVKAMMATNKCSGALTIGLLKNKNLQGETVSSQPYSETTETNSDQLEDDNEDASDRENESNEGADEGEQNDDNLGESDADGDEESEAVMDDDQSHVTGAFSPRSLHHDSEAY